LTVSKKPSRCSRFRESLTLRAREPGDSICRNFPAQDLVAGLRVALELTRRT